MGGDGHHHGPEYKIPDYKIYKVDNIPELVRVKNALAAKGLKDPWLRLVFWRLMSSVPVLKISFPLTEMKPGAMTPLSAQ